MRFVRKVYRRYRTQWRESNWNRNWEQWAEESQDEFKDRMDSRPPRVAFVKQDVQNDLYSCPPNSPAKEIVTSTLMRSGPIGLFTKLNAKFLILETVDTPECNIWKQPAEDLGWWTLDELYAYQDRVPGRDYGQRELAQSPYDVDWSDFDLVISVDCAVPAEVTKQFPQVCWGYCIREPKTRSYQDSQIRPLCGQDFFVTQLCPIDGLKYAEHLVHAPYYMQYHGCYHQLFDQPIADENREGIALEHHTVRAIGESGLGSLRTLKMTLRSTAGTSDGEIDFEAGRSVWQPSDWYQNLLRRKYFLQLKGIRVTWGNAVIEAVSAGCLLIGDPDAYGNIALTRPQTTARTASEAVELVRRLEANPELYRQELDFQRRKVNYLCFNRPVLDMFGQMDKVRERGS